MRGRHDGILRVDLCQRYLQAVHHREHEQDLHLRSVACDQLRQLRQLHAAHSGLCFGDGARSMIPRIVSRLARDTRGGAILEFAVLAPVLLTFILGGVDVGRMFYVRQSLEYATEQAARYYMMNSTAATSAVTTYLQGQMAGGMGSGISVAYA